MYCKQKELQNIFSIGSTFTTKICRLIDANEARYKGYPRIGARYSLVAFADAYKFYEELEAGKEIPEFDVTKAGYLLLVRGDIDWKHYKDKGAEEERNKIRADIKDWFDSAKIPAKCTKEKLMEVVENAMLAIASED